VSIREPTANGYSMLRVEYVRCRRIIDDDGFSKITANLGEILDVVPLVIITAFSEKAVVYNVVNIQLIQKGVTILYRLVGPQDFYSNISYL
jgi:hypothetical protein